MLTPQTFPKISVREPGLDSSGAGLSRLFAAAVVNPQFRNELLNHPRAALTNGYFGETFQLTDREVSLIVSHQASSLPDLARQITRALR